MGVGIESPRNGVGPPPLSQRRVVMGMMSVVGIIYFVILHENWDRQHQTFGRLQIACDHACHPTS